MSEPSLKLSFKLKGEDFRGYIKKSDKNARSVSYLLLAFLFFLAMVALYLFVLTNIQTIDMDNLTRYGALVSLTLVMSGLYIMVSRWLKRVLQARRVGKNPAVLRPISFEIGATGLSTDDGLSKSWYDWKAFEGVEITDDSVLLILDPLRSVIVPRRVLGDDENVQKFKTHIEAFIAASQRTA
ncbi:MAG: YcxB family protein [Alphaproteobacteria bacterium]|nr:MAG: YcxB family protein [Alphaproteobacteria bacterium]